MIVCFSLFLLPSIFHIGTKEVHHWGVMTCGLVGLWSGMIIGYFTDYYTSTEYSPV
jgi:inorganic pyrophosphatase